MIPKVYRKSSKVQATFDFNDISNNTGTNTYYLSNCDLISGGALISGAAFLATATIPASNDTLGANYESPAVGDGTTYNFDIPFNLSRSIKGDVIIFLPNFYTTGSGNTGTGFFLLEFYQALGATETFLFSGATTVRSPPANTTTAYTEVLRIPVTTRKKISAGSKLRFKLIFKHAVSTGTGTRAIYADPSNDAASLSRLYIPFTLDL